MLVDWNDELIGLYVAMLFITGLGGIFTRDPENCPQWVESNIFAALITGPYGERRLMCS